MDKGLAARGTRPGGKGQVARSGRLGAGDQRQGWRDKGQEPKDEGRGVRDEG